MGQLRQLNLSDCPFLSKERGMSMWAMIATWRMALEGVQDAELILKNGGTASDAIETAIQAVEDFPYFKSVGYGGLPNRKMEVELDAAYMDGQTLGFGAVCGIQDIANPISVARRLSRLKANNVLVGQGARDYAIAQGFETKDMLTDRAQIHYHNRQKQLGLDDNLVPYSGHDTVGMVALDQAGLMVAGTSTSGLFMKEPGRVGDSPFIGSGLYVDAQIGGASGTGMGEDIMKGILSYEIVRLMKAGKSAQEACQTAVFDFERDMANRGTSVGDISMIALAADGSWGVASNIDNFSFVVALPDQGSQVYVTRRQGDTMIHELASQAWLDNYMAERTKPLERL